ncbi:Peroxiredoxin-2E-1, chloroplastic [Dichanthelium oligosanthes]|uniref:Glutaredoxin-dependent peroxiredoxin n=1 Tax=Dichanthelium oligosanthes TaxID=888268 RepID=A0A1E5V5M4_9POAL|nr:Peroxiredoxin-2E-1, chloroplastic [Dichanthelium oligosanthes]
MATSALTALSATAAAAGKRVLLSRPSSLSFASRRLAAAGPLRARGFPGAPIRAAASAASAPAAAKTIAVGDRLPDATLSYFDSTDGELQTVTVRDLTAGKKVVLFAVPGAFTPTCTQKHLPGFVAKAGELRAKGVDAVACVSVNDAFVMRAWKESLGVGDEVMLLSDGNGDLARAMGVELDLTDKPVGLGVRSRRYALLAEDGVVKVLNLEEGGAFTNSSAEDMLKAL